MPYINIIDFLILPFYLGIFYFFARRMANKQKEADMRKYLMLAFFFRMLGSFVYALVIQYYYGYGDSFTFFKGSNFFTDQFAKDPSTLRYLFAPIKETKDWFLLVTGDDYFSGFFGNPSGNMVMKLSAVTSFLAFNRYLIVSLFFGFFSFVGQWRLFRVFDQINLQRHRKMLAFACLYSPTIWFWGSGLLKDSVCIGGLGFIVYILYDLLVKKNFSLMNIIFMLILFYIVNTIKSYIISIVIVGLGAMLFSTFLKTIKNIFFKIILLVLGFSVFIVFLVVSNFTQTISDLTQESVLQIQNSQGNYEATGSESGKSTFQIGEINPTLGSLAVKSPLVIFTCIYRPLIWESGSIMMLLTSLESMFLLYCTLYLFKKTRIIGFFKTIYENPYLVFCFTISMLFALIIGFTTFNFGTMVRYKIIFLPFFYFMLVYIYSSIPKTNKQSVLTEPGLVIL